MNRDGFTLVEVMVAIVVSSLLVLTAHRGVDTLREMADRAATGREDAIRNAAVRRQLIGWLRAAYLDEEPGAWSFQGIDRATMTGGAADVLAFPTLAPTPFAEDRALVRLMIDRDPATPETGLVALLIPSQRETPKALELIPAATGLDARYRFADADGERWLPGWSSAVRLPDAVELRILGDSVPPLLREPITVPLVTGG